MPSAECRVEETSPPPRIVAVAPTYNNARTLRRVLDGVAAHGLPIIAVNDGSHDETAAILATWAGDDHVVVTHATNQGKAAAMRTGFERAAALGYTHALTIDTDGQHDPADVAGLVRACVSEPTAIVVGTRPTDDANYPFRSRLGRSLSNGLVWLIGGVHVGDSQCGLRVYPLGLVRELGARTSRYAFETEVLARAGWANVPVAQVPIRCIYRVEGESRVTHFCPWRDSLSAVAMHARLMTRSLFLWPPRKAFAVDDDTTTGTLVERSLRWCNPMRTWRRVRVDVAERDRVAASVGWGLFIGIQPWYGLKTVLCLAWARLMSLQPLIVMGASSLTTPPIGFVVGMMSIVVGHLALHGRWPGPVQFDVRQQGMAAVFKMVAAEWIVGGLLLGTVVGTLAWLTARAAMRRLPVRAADRSFELQPSERAAGSGV